MSSSDLNKDNLIHERHSTSSEPSANHFTQFIKEKYSLEKSSTGKKHIDTKELASRLDIDYEQFRKILNMNRPTKKRDCIIAICAALRLNSDETNEALILYRYMPCLDSENPRDDFLMDILEEQFSNPLTIEQINQRLIRNGFPELDIIDHRPPIKSASKTRNAPFKILEKRVRTYSDDLILGDQYDSIMSEYSIYRYSCVAEMWLDNEKEKKVYRLIAEPNHIYSLLIPSTNNFKSFRSADDSGVFKDYFLELDAMANHEYKKMLSVLNDTKNYHTRAGAGIRNDALYVYAETFNYTVPEINEYYLFEYINGNPVLSVFRRSEFMHCYLSAEEYSSAYGKHSPSLIAQYTSFEELKSDKSSTTDIYLLKCRSRYFKKLQQQVDSLIEDIREKRRYIQRLEDSDRYNVCEYYGVKAEYKCKLTPGEYEDNLVAGVESATFQFEDCGPINVTVDDLCKAFELGFSNINEICRVKKKLGSIEKILY